MTKRYVSYAFGFLLYALFGQLNTGWSMESFSTLKADHPDSPRLNSPLDFDGNGWEDLLYWNPDQHEFIIHLMEGTEKFYTTLIPDAPGKDVQVLGTVDLNQDTRPEIVWQETETGNFFAAYCPIVGLLAIDTLPIEVTPLTQLSNDFAELIRDNQNLQAQTVVSIKENNIMKPFLVLTNASTRSRAVYLYPIEIDSKTVPPNDTPVTSASSPALYPAERVIYIYSKDGLEWNLAECGDFNLDGHPDFLWTNHPGGNYAVWYLEGTTFVKEATLSIGPPGPDWHLAALADLGQSGYPDWLWRHRDGDRLEVHFSTGVEYSASSEPLEVPGPDWILIPSHTRFLPDAPTDVVDWLEIH